MPPLHFEVFLHIISERVIKIHQYQKYVHSWKLCLNNSYYIMKRVIEDVYQAYGNLNWSTDFID